MNPFLNASSTRVQSFVGERIMSSSSKNHLHSVFYPISPRLQPSLSKIEQRFPRPSLVYLFFHLFTLLRCTLLQQNTLPSSPFSTVLNYATQQALHYYTVCFLCRRTVLGIDGKIASLEVNHYSAKKFKWRITSGSSSEGAC